MQIQVPFQRPNRIRVRCCEFSVYMFQSIYQLGKLLQLWPVILHSRSLIGLNGASGDQTVDRIYSFGIDQARKKRTRGDYCVSPDIFG